MAELQNILFVDSDAHLGKFVQRQLGHLTYHVELKNSGTDALAELRDADYDLVILALNLIGLDGMTVLRQIRKSNPNLPVLILSARNRTEDIVSGLNEGASDYVTKPFSFVELAARIHRILSRREIMPASNFTAIGDLTINRDAHRAFRGSRTINLTAREFDILDYLINNRGKVISRRTLMQDVWKSPYDPSTNIVDVYMKYLRDKVDLEGEEKLIRTIRGVGYVLGDPGPTQHRAIEPAQLYQTNSLIGAARAA